MLHAKLLIIEALHEAISYVCPWQWLGDNWTKTSKTSTFEGEFDMAIKDFVERSPALCPLLDYDMGFCRPISYSADLTWIVEKYMEEMANDGWLLIKDMNGFMKHNSENSI